MLSDQQLRRRADFVREQLEATLTVTRTAIAASAALIAETEEMRHLTSFRVSESSRHIRASHTVLAKCNPERVAGRIR